MRIRKTIALMLCLIMCLGVIPLAAVSEGAVRAEAAEYPVPMNPEAASAAETKGGERTHESYFNDASTDTHLTYYDGSIAWKDKSADSYKYIESGNAGQASTQSTLQSHDVYMYAGDTISFQYWYSTEQTYDTFLFYVNGVKKLEASGESNGWLRFDYTIPSDGLYNFIWTYSKDSSADNGSDCVRLAYMYYSGHYHEYRERAALQAGGGGLMLSNDNSYDYRFNVASSSSSSAHSLYLISSNKGVDSSVCTLEAFAFIPDSNSAAETYQLTFDYAIECENQYDGFVFSVDGVSAYTDSSEGDYNWKSYTYTITTSGMHIFKWEYIKDSSDSVGADCLALDNLRLVGYTNAWDRYLGFERHMHPDNNAQLIFNTPCGDEGFNPVTEIGIVNNNRYIDNTDSYFEAMITMDAGESFSFDYLVSSEDYDYFKFYVDGTLEISESGWKNPQVKTYTFTSDTLKTYTFRWQYSKDYSISRGYDMVLITNILYEGAYLPGLSSGDIDVMLNHDYTDVWLEFIGGAGVGGWFDPYVSPNGWDAVVSTNKYYEGASSSIGTTCFMYTGDKLEFEYLVSSESGGDYFNFEAMHMTSASSGEVVDGFYESGDTGWCSYTFVCPATGTYWFSWWYEKDNSIDSLDDLAMLDNVCVIREHELDRALNPDGMSEDDWLWFDSDGDYCFEPVEFEGRYCARSTNHSGSTEAQLTTNVYISTANGGQPISFDYFVSCEATYDYLVFFVNDVEVARFSGTENEGWHTFTTTQKYSGYTELKWVYHKDGNLSYGSDMAAVDNVRIGAGGLLGDADGNRTVNANDALLILRYALGIIPASALDLSVCDVDGNGTVNANDALLVLRAALGIITL